MTRPVPAWVQRGAKAVLLSDGRGPRRRNYVGITHVTITGVGKMYVSIAPKDDSKSWVTGMRFNHKRTPPFLVDNHPDRLYHQQEGYDSPAWSLVAPTDPIVALYAQKARAQNAFQMLAQRTKGISLSDGIVSFREIRDIATELVTALEALEPE